MNQQQYEVVPFERGDIKLSQVVYIDSVPYMTKHAIGEWLEYADPRNAVNHIIERNPHIEQWATEIKLPASDGKNYNTAVFHPIGFLLIVMESDQPRAREMKTAVAEFVWRFAGPKPVTLAMEIKLTDQMVKIAGVLTKTRDAFAVRLLTGQLRDICGKLGRNMPDLKYLGQDVDQLGFEI